MEMGGSERGVAEDIAARLRGGRAGFRGGARAAAADAGMAHGDGMDFPTNARASSKRTMERGHSQAAER